jgi:hypothetical protein
MVKEWLENNMLTSGSDPHVAAETVVSKLMDYNGTGCALKHLNKTRVSRRES